MKIKYGLPGSLRDFINSKRVEPTIDNIIPLIKGWIYHSRFLSRYAQSEKDEALAELENLKSLKTLPDSLEMEYLFDICNLANQFSLWDKMRQALGKMGTLSSEIGSEIGRAQAEYFSAALCINNGQYQEAIDHYRKALIYARGSGDAALESEVLNDIGFCYRRLGENSMAESFYKQSLEMRRRRKDLMGEAESLNNLGMLMYEKGLLSEAEKTLSEALDIELRIGDRIGAGYSLVNLGYIKKNRGCLSEAIELYNRALEFRKEIDDVLGIAYCYCQLAHIAEERGDYSSAQNYIELAIHDFKESEDLNGFLESCMTKADILWNLGKKEEALGLLGGIEEKVNACEGDKIHKRYKELVVKFKIA